LTESAQTSIKMEPAPIRMLAPVSTANMLETSGDEFITLYIPGPTSATASWRIMNGLPYYKRYPRDLIEGTIGMSFELKGAYGLILDMIYMQGGFLPDDSSYISGLLGCNKHKWASLRKQLLETGKIQLLDGFLANSRAFLELKETEKHQRKQSEIASKPRKNKGLRQPEPSHTDTDTDTEDIDKESISITRQFSDDFEVWWKDEYPERKGNQGSKAKAKDRYIKHRKSGVSREAISKATDSYFKELIDQDRIGTEFVQHATTWLNNRYWEND